MTEEQIMAATVGPRLPLNSTIYLAPYDPGWPSVFAQLKKQLEELLDDKIQLLEHVGSTSVPGLSAKPIIDMVMAVADSRDEAAYVRPLAERGYTLRIREPEWYEHRLLKPPDVQGNLHVFSAGCPEIERMVLFRDWLRNHPEDRLLYEATKRDLAARTWKYVQNYADAKSEVVAAILARARP
ncbi:MAG: GrpB family protein [Anaerolineae bacterium]|nr:GrpB family protein [Anaerolineae bacterium]